MLIKKDGVFIVREWDGTDWNNMSHLVSNDTAVEIWRRLTNDGRRDKDKYKIFRVRNAPEGVVQ